MFQIIIEEYQHLEIALLGRNQVPAHSSARVIAFLWTLTQEGVLNQKINYAREEKGPGAPQKYLLRYFPETLHSRSSSPEHSSRRSAAAGARGGGRRGRRAGLRSSEARPTLLPGNPLPNPRARPAPVPCSTFCYPMEYKRRGQFVLS